MTSLCHYMEIMQFTSHDFLISYSVIQHYIHARKMKALYFGVYGPLSRHHVLPCYISLAVENRMFKMYLYIYIQVVHEFPASDVEAPEDTIKYHIESICITC